MNEDPVEMVGRCADAVKSIAETATKGMDLTERAGAFLVRLLGENGAGIFQDRLYYYRAKNAVALQEKLDSILEQRQIQNPRSIPLRLAIPFLQAATLEEDVTLQERWAHLLASAMDPEMESYVERCHGEILQSLSPLECDLLQELAIIARERHEISLESSRIAELTEWKDTDAIELALGNLWRNALVERHTISFPISRHTTLGAIMQEPYGVTEFGYSFLKACGARGWEV
ncbi:MAG: Abi-alpha family protein [FCB group bacterium]|jgi:hypothetical protein|nr:Abi-alpha family protein [FCB group bacterium]